MLLVSAACMAAGFALDMLRGWGGAPAPVATAVRAYFALFVTVRNGLFEGFFYVALGMALGVHSRRALEIDSRLLSVGTVLGLLGSVLVSSDAHLPFCGLASCCVFLLSCKRHGSGLAPRLWARRASIVVYLVHMYCVVVLAYGLFGVRADHPLDGGAPELLLFALAAVCSLAFAATIIRMSELHPALGRVFGL